MGFIINTHYDLASAMIKSLRGSDIDAALLLYELDYKWWKVLILSQED